MNDVAVEEIIKSQLSELFSLLGVDSYEVNSVSRADDYYYVSVSSESSALLIGRNGENLSALQHILRMIIKAESQTWVPVVLDINNYLEEKKVKLEQTALALAEKVKETGEVQELVRLNSSERRIVHMALKDDKDVVTQSVDDEEEGRRLFIKSASSKE